MTGGTQPAFKSPKSGQPSSDASPDTEPRVAKSIRGDSTDTIAIELKVSATVHTALGDGRYLIDVHGPNADRSVPSQVTIVVDNQTQASKGTTACRDIQLAAGNDLGAKLTELRDGTYYADDIGLP
jgi:hypothetical protein